MTSRLKVLYLLSKYPWGGEKCKMGNMYVFNAHFGSSFCCLISQFSHSSIPQKWNSFQTKFTDPAKWQSQNLSNRWIVLSNLQFSRNSPTLQKDILTIYQLDASCRQIFNSLMFKWLFHGTKKATILFLNWVHTFHPHIPQTHSC